jgi:hypothetical protein
MSTAESTQSNKFLWETYETPCWSYADSDHHSPSHHTFTIRHLKQGATGARKTWQASEILLNHLLCEGGPLRDEGDVRNQNGSSDDERNYKILEIGSGAGCVAVGLATALNHEECQRQRPDAQTNDKSTKISSKFHPKAKIMCTDNDKATIKNLRHNIARQPKDRNASKAIRVASLGWGDDVGGAEFDKALMDQFCTKRKARPISSEKLTSSLNIHEHSTIENDEEKDPMRLLTHLIGSDLLYGGVALEPLSSVISAVKLRNPDIIVIIMIRERSPNAVANLKARIEDKVCRGIELQQQESELDLLQQCPYEAQHILETFSVNVQDIVDDKNMIFKLMEC